MYIYFVCFDVMYSGEYNVSDVTLRFYPTPGEGGGGCELVLPDQKGVVKVVPRRTFQSLINISFPKIVGEPGAGEKKFSDMPFFHTNLPKFVQFFSNFS